jgi:hypothetical protein
MNWLVVMGVTILFLALFISAASAGTLERFQALSNVQNASLLTNQELSEVEGSALVFGSINTPLYYASISAFLNEVLLTLLGVDGRSPIATYTTVSTTVTPLPTGGVSIGLQPNTFILVKNLFCVGCTRP